MADEIDKATEARRKALRNGEEDPVIVAQRFLNIYRQRHIFSAERKEAFDKMLLELSPDIRGLFSSLPGGVMLQDYVDELAEKNGVAKAVHHDIPAGGLNPEAHQQAQILAAALAQTQAPVQQTTAPAAAVGKISMDKDFAGELARVMSGLMQQQTAAQQQSLEKLALDLGKTQMFIAKMLKEGKEEQLREISTLCRVIAEGNSKEKEEQKQELGELCKAIIDSQRLGKEEQRQELGELCKAIAQSQTALSASLSSIGKETAAQTPAPPQLQPAYDDSATKKLIEVVLDGQKQINSRLDKVEEFSSLRANDNQQLIAAFEKSQAEIVKSLSSVKFESIPVQSGGNEEKLAQIIGESQEKLVQMLLNGNFQQNNVAQSTNNANNIQITAPDNSAQLLLLVDKIAALQAANEDNLEKAITRAIEEQGRLYDKISRQQTKELAEIIAESLKGAVQPVVYTVTPEVVRPEQGYQMSENTILQKEPSEEPAHIPPLMDEDDGFRIDLPVAEEEPAAETETLPDEETFAAAEVEEAQEEPDTEISSGAGENDIPVVAEEPKKKKKRRKKKKKKTTEAENTAVPAEPFIAENVPQEEEPAAAFDFEDIKPDENMSFSDLPETGGSETPEEVVPQTEEPFETEDKAFWETEEPLAKLDESILQGTDGFIPEPVADSGDDWGFGTSAEPEETPVGNNDNEEGEDWEWAYVEDTGDDENGGVDVIGGNSYIYSSDLYSQEKADNGGSIIYGSQAIDMNTAPIIVDNAGEEEFVDPYQNSILKD